MNLVIDVGNTRIKYAFFRDNQLVEAKYCVDGLSESIGKYRRMGECVNLLLSGSGKISDDLREMLKESVDWSIETSNLMPLPLKIGYATPETLGFDRIAICTGAMVKFPARPLLVIDSGTCITFNYIDAEGTFLGGNISPGVDIRFQSLQYFTAKLPLVAPSFDYGKMGQTTEEAIRNGVMNGMLFEVKNYIHEFMETFKSGRVIVTGGNSVFLEKKLTNEVEFCSVLGFIGLNEILMFAKKI